MVERRFILSALSLLSACGDPRVAVDSGLRPPDGGGPCRLDSDCDDGVCCDSVELCRDDNRDSRTDDDPACVAMRDGGTMRDGGIVRDGGIPRDSGADTGVLACDESVLGMAVGAACRSGATCRTMDRLQTCTSASDCAAGHACASILADDTRVCLPLCAVDADCRSGEHCRNDSGTGCSVDETCQCGI
jgi:hypothetical protein